MIRHFKPWALALSLVLCGCASNQIHYYTLSAQNVPATDPVPDKAGYLIDVLPVGLPALVDRQEMVVSRGPSVAILDGERWVAQLGDEVHDALALQLSTRLGVQNVSGLIIPADASVVRVKVMIRAFESAPGQYALLDADWSLTRSDVRDKPYPVCHSRLSATPEGQGEAALAQAHRRMLDAMAGQIALTVRHWMTQGDADCVQLPEPSGKEAVPAETSSGAVLW